MYTYKAFHFISNHCMFCKWISYKKMLFPIKWDGHIWNRRLHEHYITNGKYNFCAL